MPTDVGGLKKVGSKLRCRIVALCLAATACSAWGTPFADGRYGGSMSCEPTAENRNRAGWQMPVQLMVAGNSITWTRDQGTTQESIKATLNANALAVSGYGGTRNMNAGTLNLEWKTDASLTISATALSGPATISSKDGSLTYSRCQVEFPLTGSAGPVLPPALFSPFDGPWTGTISCGRIAVPSSYPEGFTGTLNLSVSRGRVAGRRESASFLETFGGVVDDSGRLSLHGSGQRMDDVTKIWQYRAEGQINTREIAVEGPMETASTDALPHKPTKLRDCRFALTNMTSALANAASGQKRVDDERATAAKRLQAEHDQAEQRDSAARLVEALPAAAISAAGELASKRTSVRVTPTQKPATRSNPVIPQVVPSASEPTVQSRAMDKPLIGPPAPSSSSEQATSSSPENAAELKAKKAADEKIAVDEQAARLANTRAASDRAATERLLAETAAAKAAAEGLAARKAAAVKLKKQPVRAQSSMDL